MPSPAAKLLADLSSVLTSLALRWYVFGAQAVLIYARPRLTEDVDVTVFLAGLSHHKLCDELAACGFELDKVADDEFIQQTRVLPFTHAASGMALDIVLGGPGLEELFMSGALPQSIAGIEIPVIRAEHLLVTKILAGREKDKSDAREILFSLDELDLDMVRALLRELEEALDRSDLLPLLDALASAEQ